MDKENLDMAYAAGALDGDGSFYICRRENKKSIKYVAGVNIGKSSKQLIDFFSDRFEGNIDQRGDHYRFAISCSKRLIPFLEKIIPYINTKKNQAAILLNWLKEGMPNKEETYLAFKNINQERVDELEPANDCIIEEPLKWAYLAGLMDTDGCFMINKRNNHNKMKSPNHTARISFGEVDARPLSYIKNVFPFGTVNKKDYSNTKNGRFVWELVVIEEIKEFLNRILPYMLVKKPNAEILLNFCINRSPTKKGHRFGVPPEELAFREKCYEELQKYQRR